jgi:predicted MFS family arabinose efflux permease
MTVCVFAVIASEFLPVSLLTPLAADLHVSEGMAGQGITISAIFAVLTSLSLSSVAGSMSRKTLLLGLTVLMCLSGAIIGLAPSFGVYMIGRALIGVVVGGFWSLAAATAMRLVPSERVPRALAIFNGGNALATIVAPPVGSYLGAAIGWRGAFLCLVPIAIAAFVWQWVSLPAMRPEIRSASKSTLGLLRHRKVAIGMLAVSAFFMGQFTLFTYVRPFLETVTHVDGATLSLILLAMGVAGFIGTVVMGALDRFSFYYSLVAFPLAMAAIGIALMSLGGLMAATVVLLALWAFVATPAPVGWWSWLAKALPGNAETGGGLMVAVIQLAIGLGSVVGGVLFDNSGYQSTFAASAALLLASAALAALTARTDQVGR